MTDFPSGNLRERLLIEASYHADRGVASSARMEALPKLLREAADALAPRAPASGWQPIASAPKDGTLLLLYERFVDAHGESDDYRYIGRWKRNEWIDDMLGETTAPTHWMPLPAPPPEEP